jgi:FkbM family methyltransferase
MKKLIFSCASVLITYSLIAGTSIKQGPITKKLIARYLPAKPIIVEAGAHIGTDTIAMSKLWRRGRIFAFEPIPAIFEQLKKNTVHCKNVRCIQKALSNTNGIANMFVSQGNINGSSSLFTPKEHLLVDPKISFPSQVQVETITLDDWARSMQLPRIDFLWLDMQGAEPIALKSGVNILKTVRAIYTEVNLAELYEGIVLYRDFKAWLNEQGFVVVKEDLRTATAGKFANVLFCRKELVKH